MSRAVSPKGLKNVRAAFVEASRALADRDVDQDMVANPNEPRGGIRAGKWAGFPWDGMPPKCPVQVLGHNGDVTFCRSASGQLVAVDGWQNGVIERLFAPFINYAHWAWPAFKKAGVDDDGEPIYIVDRLERDKARNALLNEGARRGLFDPMVSVRGRGGWRDRHDAFIWNSGEYLWTVNGRRLDAARPAEYDGFFYEKKTDVTRPWEEPVEVAESPAARILKDLATWSWERPKIDALLVLGWLVTGFMGGALKWRPVIFTTGGAGVGKSTLQALVKGVLGSSLLDTTDTTQAGIYQRVRNDCLPVMVDELENKAGDERAMKIVELARIAASGGNMNRGGSDHNATMFQARNSFLFGAINPPPLGVQDKSRMAILNLSRLDKSRKAMEMTINENDGRMILRQVMDGWPTFIKEVLPRWKRALHDGGMDSRAQDTYGTLLAAAELVVGPMAFEDAGLDTTEMVRVGTTIAEMTMSERAEQTDNWQDCLEWLLVSPIEAWRSGERITVGSVIDDLKAGRIDLDQAKFRLGAAGLGVRYRDAEKKRMVLAVPHKGPALAKIFADQVWRGGVWTSALKQGPKHVVLRDLDQKFHKNRINGTVLHCLLIDMLAFEAEVTGVSEAGASASPPEPEEAKE